MPRRPQPVQPWRAAPAPARAAGPRGQRLARARSGAAGICACDLRGVRRRPACSSVARVGALRRRIEQPSDGRGEEALGAAGGGPDPRQVGGVLEADEARLPLRLVLRVGAVERLELPVAAGQQQRLPPQPGHRAGAELRAALERLAEHREVQRHPAARRSRGACSASELTMQLDQPVVGGGVAAHQVERQPVAAPRHEAEEAAQRCPRASCASTSTQSPSSGSPSRPSAIEKPRSSPPSPRH